MVKRFLKSVDYRFWVFLAFWTGLKIAFALGILLIVMASSLGIFHNALVLLLFVPAVFWAGWVFKDINLFAQRVKTLLRLD